MVVYIKGNKNPYNCIKCNYTTIRKSHWIRHLNTVKHNKCLDNSTIIKKYDLQNKQPCINNSTRGGKCMEQQKQEKYENICVCGKKYKFNSGLSRHRKKCLISGEKLYVKPPNQHMINIYNSDETSETNNILKEQNQFLQNQIIEMKDIFYKLIENNKELQETTMMIAKEPRTVNNNQFNIMNYLNTECKDAINLTEFIEQLKYTFNDLLKITDEGWVENVKNTFIKKLKDMEQSKRPIHCSDKKRKTFYVKDNNVWEKDTIKEKLSESIKLFHNKQSKVYINWKRLNKEKVIKSDDLHDKSMYMNIELCKLSCENSEKLKNKIFHSMSELTLQP